MVSKLTTLLPLKQELLSMAQVKANGITFNCAIEGAVSGRGMPLATTPWVRTYCPVSMVDRAGMQTVFWL